MRIVFGWAAALAFSLATAGYGQDVGVDVDAGRAGANAEVDAGDTGVNANVDAGPQGASVNANVDTGPATTGETNIPDNGAAVHIEGGAQAERHSGPAENPDRNFRWHNSRWWYRTPDGWLVYIDSRWIPYEEFRRMSSARVYYDDGYSSGPSYRTNNYPRRYSTGYRGNWDDDNYYNDGRNYDNRFYGRRYSQEERAGASIGGAIGESIGGRDGGIIGAEIGREIAD